MSNTIVVYGKTAFHFNYLNTYEHNEKKKEFNTPLINF